MPVAIRREALSVLDPALDRLGTTPTEKDAKDRGTTAMDRAGRGTGAFATCDEVYGVHRLNALRSGRDDHPPYTPTEKGMRFGWPAMAKAYGMDCTGSRAAP